MEISEVINTQFVFPGIVVGIVLVFAALVFVFGFKSVEDFPFDKLAAVADDRKPAGKKRKVKDKKSQSNGQATVVSETKPKSSDNASTKVVITKAKSTEKSPVKDAPNPSNKQDKKQTKQELSPVKAALKDTKNIKESNKISSENPKQVKVKDVQKQENNQQSNKQGKSKGKENVEVKNKKNVEKSKPKAVEKVDEDEGEWEQAISRKDKKNRKLPTSSDDENMAGKLGTPAKKKKTKTVAESELTISSLKVEKAADTSAPVAEEHQKETKEKLLKKETKKEKSKPDANTEVGGANQEKDENELIPMKQVNINGKDTSNVEKSTPTKPRPVQVNVEVTKEDKVPEKSTKKNKKKSTDEDTVLISAPVVEEIPVAKEESAPEPKEPTTENAPAFDELGDSWIEPKSQKKASKKKVRKAE